MFERIDNLHIVTIVWDEFTGRLKGLSKNNFQAFQEIKTGKIYSPSISDPEPIAPEDLSDLLGVDNAELLSEISHLQKEIENLKKNLASLQTP